MDTKSSTLDFIEVVELLSLGNSFWQKYLAQNPLIRILWSFQNFFVASVEELLFIVCSVVMYLDCSFVGLFVTSKKSAEEGHKSPECGSCRYFASDQFLTNGANTAVPSGVKTKREIF